MRYVFLGASETTVFTAEALLEDGHEVVIVESDAERIEELSEHLDCSFLRGDGGRPAILREAGVEDADVIFCVTDDDRANILAGLVARDLGARRIVVSVEDDDLENVCARLDIDNVIVPARTISRHLHDLARGIDSVELSTVLKHDARLFRFRIDKETAGPIADLDLPDRTRVAWIYRKKACEFVEQDSELREHDEVVLLTTVEYLKDLETRWGPERAGDG